MVVCSLIHGKLSSFLFRDQYLLRVQQNKKKADKSGIIFLRKTERSLSSLHLKALFMHSAPSVPFLSTTPHPDCCLLEWDSFTSPSKECHIFGSSGGICNFLACLHFLMLFACFYQAGNIWGEGFSVLFIKLDI